MLAVALLVGGIVVWLVVDPLLMWHKERQHRARRSGANKAPAPPSTRRALNTPTRRMNWWTCVTADPLPPDPARSVSSGRRRVGQQRSQTLRQLPNALQV